MTRSVGSSNRTFMELKYYQGNCKCGRTVSSNRTFMELKYLLIMRIVQVLLF